ncbi:hypothetical protein SAY86_001908 [Trapa natans]|uniref:Auxin-responsive protein n=1 Tax=Trapa natans TaxID=22666 RepID=A0AAN7LJC4_TRANT|nr:hypothetical protein SAY86_001908 [Trapa natans]
MEGSRKGAVDMLAGAELSLGLPGGDGAKLDFVRTGCKRGFSATEVDLKLDLNAKESPSSVEKVKPADPARPPAKAQVVGWPPVRSYRKNAMAHNNKNSSDEDQAAEKGVASGAAAALSFVKVSMDGAPYLRKIDLKMYKTYKELSDALGKMFGSFTADESNPSPNIRWDVHRIVQAPADNERIRSHRPRSQGHGEMQGQRLMTSRLSAGAKAKMGLSIRPMRWKLQSFLTWDWEEIVFVVAEEEPIRT